MAMLPFLMTLFFGFFVGAVTILAAEAFGILFIIRRLNRKIEQEEAKSTVSQSSAGLIELDPSVYNKQGVVWVIESEKVPKTWIVAKGPREQKRKKDILEVAPVRKYAKIKDRLLVLTESDNSHTKILLKGCIIAAVSATSLSSRKWAKRYPIKLESKTSVIYHESKTLYMYVETSWEKESWCKALRLASCDDKEKLNWFANLNLDFQRYLTSLNTGYPSFMKPPMGFTAESMDKSIKFEGSSSKVRHFLKKLAKKASKSGIENKATWSSTSGREEKKVPEKSRLSQEPILATGLLKTATIGKAPNCSVEENMVPSSLSSFPQAGSRSSVISETDSDDINFGDEGTLCWNLLISRLYFDAKSNEAINSSILARIQRTLSNMRSPSFIGEVTCTGINPGNLPPYIHGMRVLPSDMNEVWALEIDIEYSGGAVLDVETRLEVRDLDFQEGIVDANLDPNSMEEVTADLLEGFESFGEQLKLSERTVVEVEQKEEADSNLDRTKSSKSSTRASSSVSRWKSILNSLAKQFSQVPLSLGIRIASLRGTMRLHIKPPPSDQLWFGFTSMPSIDFNLESFVGDHKIPSGHIAQFLIARFKAAIHESMVHPNCENISIPWMLAEKDDWVPRKDAPFIWIKQAAVSDPTTAHEVASSQPGDKTHVIQPSKRATGDNVEDKHDKAKEVEHGESPDTYASSSSLTNQATLNDNPSQQPRAPLLANDDPYKTRQGCEEENSGCQTPTRPLMLVEEQNHFLDGDDTRTKTTGTRAKMLSFGKKVGAKFDEKRRHIEEKSRHIAEKMRGPQN